MGLGEVRKEGATVLRVNWVFDDSDKGSSLCDLREKNGFVGSTTRPELSRLGDSLASLPALALQLDFCTSSVFSLAQIFSNDC